LGGKSTRHDLGLKKSGPRGRALSWKEIAAPVRPALASSAGLRVGVVGRKGKWVPLKEHPWRQAVRRAVQRKAARLSMAEPSASP